MDAGFKSSLFQIGLIFIDYLDIYFVIIAMSTNKLYPNNTRLIQHLDNNYSLTANTRHQVRLVLTQQRIKDLIQIAFHNSIQLI